MISASTMEVLIPSKSSISRLQITPPLSLSPLFSHSLRLKPAQRPNFAGLAIQNPERKLEDAETQTPPRTFFQDQKVAGAEDESFGEVDKIIGSRALEGEFREVADTRKWLIFLGSFR